MFTELLRDFFSSRVKWDQQLSQATGWNLDLPPVIQESHLQHSHLVFLLKSRFLFFLLASSSSGLM